MNKTERLAQIEQTIREKFLILESVAKDMKLVEELGLLTGTDYDQFLARWGFDRKRLISALNSVSIYADISAVMNPGDLAEMEFTVPFENLDRDERRKLAAALKDKTLTYELICRTKENLFPFKCLSL